MTDFSTWSRANLEAFARDASAALRQRPACAELLEAARAVVDAARCTLTGKPPNRHSYTTSGLGDPLERLHAAVNQYPFGRTPT